HTFAPAVNVPKSGISAMYNIGIKAEKGILCDFICFSSDERVKEVIGVSNSKADLSTLLAIEVTDYKKKDKIQFGEQATKKLIAQQVKSVFPEAVSFSTDVIPDIYKIAEIKEGYIALKTDLEKGDRVKLIFEDKEEVVEVIKTDKKGFFIDNKKEGKVFVYGKEVNDFHVVDYDAVAMLNVSATQELHKIITSQQKIIQNLKNQLSSQGARLEETKINQSDFEARLKSLETEDSITTSNK
ncbi:MAG: tail fiber domain-containing protein, partial [Flavobacteriales bacterium]